MRLSLCLKPHTVSLLLSFPCFLCLCPGGLVLASGHLEMTSEGSTTVEVFSHWPLLEPSWAAAGCFVSVALIDPSTLAMHWTTSPMVVSVQAPSPVGGLQPIVLSAGSVSASTLHVQREVSTTGGGAALSRARRQSESVTIHHVDIVAGESMVAVNIQYATQGVVGDTLVRMSFKLDTVLLGAKSYFVTSPSGSFSTTIPVSQPFLLGDTNK